MTHRFAELPVATNSNGQPRLCGVEIELGGLSERRVAEIVAETLGGTIVDEDKLLRVEGSRIGKLEVYLDIFLRKSAKSALRDLSLRLGQEIIPVEIVTEPLKRDGLLQLDALRDALRGAGAIGTGGGLLLGFGVHLNVEIASDADADVVRPCFAYAVIEDWLRLSRPIDQSRHVLPFTDPYPTAFVRRLVEAGPDMELDDLVEIYLSETNSRNRGLDMLPILAHLRPDATKGKLSFSVSARPTFHFRLPDCRIDEPGWSLDEEWERWRIVERVAQETPLLEELGAAWLENHGPVTFFRDEWGRAAGKILTKAGLV